jgi:hypothetical protein
MVTWRPIAMWHPNVIDWSPIISSFVPLIHDQRIPTSKRERCGLDIVSLEPVAEFST